MRTLTFNYLNGSCSPPSRPCPLKGLHDLDLDPVPKGVVKGQPPNIAMFGIKLKILMSILTIDV